MSDYGNCIKCGRAASGPAPRGSALFQCGACLLDQEDHDRIKAEALREAAAYCGPTQHMTYAELLVRADALDPPGETTDR